MVAIAEKIEIHQCCNCGKAGSGMVHFNEYIGGKGMVEVWECPECLTRTETQSKAAVQALRRNLWELKKLRAMPY